MTFVTLAWIALIVGAVFGPFYYFGQAARDRSKAALVPLGIVSLIFLSSLFVGAGSQDDDPISSPRSPVTTQSSTTTTTRVVVTTTTIDPYIGRPAYDEFLLLSLLDADIAEICQEKFGSDTAACYDAYKRGTPASRKRSPTT